MSSLRRVLGIALLLGSPALAAAAAPAAPRESALDLHWRSIGPFRAGWSTCAGGIPD